VQVNTQPITGTNFSELMSMKMSL